MRRIIKGQGTVKIEDVKLVENYVRISGKLYFQILYVTDQGEPMPAVLDGKIPFEEMVYTEGEERIPVFCPEYPGRVRYDPGTLQKDQYPRDD